MDKNLEIVNISKTVAFYNISNYIYRQLNSGQQEPIEGDNFMDSKTLRSSISILNPAKPICVKTDTSISDAIQIMRDKHIGCVCVVENGQLVGIFSERDVLKKIVGGKVEINSTKVEDVMTPSPEYLYEEDQLAYALNRMHVGGFRHIPLINFDGQPTGLISIRDIVRHLVNSMDIKN